MDEAIYASTPTGRASGLIEFTGVPERAVVLTVHVHRRIVSPTTERRLGPASGNDNCLTTHDPRTISIAALDAADGDGFLGAFHNTLLGIAGENLELEMPEAEYID